MMRKKISTLADQKTYKNQHIFFGKAYEETDNPWSGDGSVSKELVRVIKKIKPKLKLKCVLDIGSGEGRHSIFLNQNGFNVIGLEYQEQALQRAKRKWRNKRLHYVRADIFRIPLKPRSFDVLIDFGVFHHIKKKDSLLYLDMLASMLIPGGYLVLSCFSRKFKHGNGKIYKRGYVQHKNHFDRFLSKSELRKTFSKKFEVLSIKEVKVGFLDGLFRLNT